MDKKILLAITTTSLVAVGITTLTSQATFKVKAGATPYTCASIHFGMDDSTLTALTYDCSTGATISNAVVSGVNVSDSTFTKVYCGDAKSTNYAIRLGSSSAKGVLSLTFDESICGCTIYALGYGTDNSRVSVNGEMKSLTSNYTTMNTKANAEQETYVPYSWTFDSTNELTIESYIKSKCRFFIADIALRVVA